MHETERFLEGLQKDEDGIYRIVQSYFPCPQELVETGAWKPNYGYHVYFDPSPDAWKVGLDLPGVKEAGIEDRTQLMEFLKPSGWYEKGLKVHNNLFKYGFKSWQDWRVTNWGYFRGGDFDTKLIIHFPGCLVFEFWSTDIPPCTAINHIATLFPELEFLHSYFEYGYGYIGYAQWENGEWMVHCREAFCPYDEEDEYLCAYESGEFKSLEEEEEESWTNAYEEEMQLTPTVIAQAEEIAEE